MATSTSNASLVDKALGSKSLIRGTIIWALVIYTLAGLDVASFRTLAIEGWEGLTTLVGILVLGRAWRRGQEFRYQYESYQYEDEI